MTINGARADNTNFLIDGFNNQNPRDANPQARPNLDAMEEFKIQTSGYSAESGRLAGGVMNVVLRSGGNQFHGAAFEFLRNDKFDARNFFNTSKSELRRNQFGATVEGPVGLPKIYNGRDRTFFLFSWESYRQIQGQPSLQVVPTLAARQGNFAGLAPIKDPLATGTCSATNAAACFPNNQIPASRISPTSLAIQQYYPLPNMPGVNNFYIDPRSVSNWDSYVVKIDQHISSTDSLSFRYLVRPSNGTGPFSGSIPAFLAGTNGDQSLAGLSYTRLFRPTLINEARFGVSRTHNGGTGGHQDKNYNAMFGIPGPTNPYLQGFPIVQISNYSYLGDASNEPMRIYVTNYTVGDTLTWVSGSHLIKIGGEVNHMQWNNLYINNQRGTFAFTGSWTTQPYADFLLGFLNSATRAIGTNQNYLRGTNEGFFMQDDWKILPRLTLNIGLRYELPLPVHEKNDRWANYMPEYSKYVYSADPTAQIAGSAFTDPTKVATAAQLGVPDSLVYARYNDLAPRFGLAWRPFGDNRTSIRGGYGIFYGSQLYNNVNVYLGQVFPFLVSQGINRNTANPQYLSWVNPFPVTPSLSSNIATVAVSGWELHAPTPNLQSWNLTMEREVGFDSVIEVGYSASKGTHLSRVYNINQPFRSAAAYPNFPVPYPGWSTINYIGFGFDSSYESASATFRRRFARGVFYRLSYTYGKSLDDASQLGVSSSTIPAGTGGMQDPRNFRLERGRSDWDAGHTFTMSFSWEIPGPRHLLLRGWQLAGTGTARTGQPFTPHGQQREPEPR